ncbi:MAG: hypothetical protein A3A33_01210 [Candidatus Yanofskybacteria bacterium RIFCSPLOWO2_01_FULL_49_25]|uniref:Uncharacterized protein n=1 Tax=Candidatus Yanofskybacteria bacterium RIFCSPLOWO2_01_FULL_49_25 TaxID=1802701 RepID=A0A1F8GWZ6_9BACT|nr:MAG: hypothetical protein A3A33_01210 [Candidatus Yanofskybacteria bacterium RIFCSPLOWO2_01_FULL_49_25]
MPTTGHHGSAREAVLGVGTVPRSDYPYSVPLTTNFALFTRRPSCGETERFGLCPIRHLAGQCAPEWVAAVQESRQLGIDVLD